MKTEYGCFDCVVSGVQGDDQSDSTWNIQKLSNFIVSDLTPTSIKNFDFVSVDAYWGSLRKKNPANLSRDFWRRESSFLVIWSRSHRCGFFLWETNNRSHRQRQTVGTVSGTVTCYLVICCLPSLIFALLVICKIINGSSDYGGADRTPTPMPKSVQTNFLENICNLKSSENVLVFNTWRSSLIYRLTVRSYKTTGVLVA
jgi:hypothetical protein